MPRTAGERGKTWAPPTTAEIAVSLPEVNAAVDEFVDSPPTRGRGRPPPHGSHRPSRALHLRLPMWWRAPSPGVSQRDRPGARSLNAATYSATASRALTIASARV